MKLPHAAWRDRPGLDRLLAALDAGDGATRWVGGAVRDTLLGLPVADIDCATTIPPDKVIERLREAGIKAVPTGLAHGTVTAVVEGKPIEVTTLRRDLSTDGRRATVAFTDDWREDAARRDFTINALSAEPASGEVHDYFGGLDDLEARRIRFIGDPLRRIAEDHLRILRFFRFHARFGEGEMDEAGLAACTARANDLMALSRERIADELLKLLALPDPRATLRAMLDGAILRPVLPEIGESGFARLDRLIAREQALAIAPSAIRRLAALLPADAGGAIDVARRLRLSRAGETRLQAAASSTPDDVENPRELAYRLGRAGALDRMLLAPNAEEQVAAAVASIVDWPIPILPIKGGKLVAMGLVAGPAVATTLRAVEQRWIDEGFPDAARTSALAEAEVAARLDGQPRGNTKG